MQNKKERKTLNVTKDFKDQLDKMRRGSESYEEVLRREIGGFERELKSIDEQSAFELVGIYSDEAEIREIQVSWTMLYNSKIGDFWALPDSEHCIRRRTAKVIYRDEDLVIIKFVRYHREDGKTYREVSTVSYKFLKEL